MLRKWVTIVASVLSISQFPPEEHLNSANKPLALSTLYDLWWAENYFHTDGGTRAGMTP